MAAVIKCECCGKIVSHKQTKHIRVYNMNSATTYNSAKTIEVADICDECYANVIAMIKKEAE